ncbi:MAG: hypothetical protein AAFQ43_07150 [Bacteroidota bacterium]
MLNLALVGLLAGSLLTVPTTGDDEKDDKTKKADAQESVVIIDAPEVDAAALEVRPSVQDSWALGRSASPIKLWIEGGFGTAESIYNTRGEEAECMVGGGALLSSCDIKSQRALVGVEVTPLQLANFGVSIGGTLSAAKNELEPGSDNVGLLTESLESDFSVQNLKIYGAARGRVLGVHAGYLLDLGDEQQFSGPIPQDIVRSDNRDAINLGVDFDYPAGESFRLFGGIDYYQILENEDVYGPSTGGENEFGEEGDGLWNFVFGGGFKASIFELGVAAQIVARDRQPVDRNGEGTPGTTPNIGGYVSTLSPYLRISPPNLPVGLYLKGGLMDEYNTYGLGIDGANGPKPNFGLTGGLSIGFN